MEVVNFLFDFLKDPLTVLQQFLADYDKLTYALLFTVVFMETGLVVMPLLPGDSLLFAVGFLAASTGELEIAYTIPLMISAALLGDNTNYFVGSKFGNYIKSKEKILFLKREYIENTEKFYDKHGGIAVILARFVPIVRTVAPFVAGAGSMKYRKYILYCVIGAVVWVGGITLIGYFLGTNAWVQDNFTKVVLAIILVSVMPMIIGFIKMQLGKRKAA